MRAGRFIVFYSHFFVGGECAECPPGGNGKDDPGKDVVTPCGGGGGGGRGGGEGEGEGGDSEVSFTSRRGEGGGGGVEEEKQEEESRGTRRRNATVSNMVGHIGREEEEASSSSSPGDVDTLTDTVKRLADVVGELSGMMHRYFLCFFLFFCVFFLCVPASYLA